MTVSHFPRGRTAKEKPTKSLSTHHDTGRFEKHLRSSREALGTKPAFVPLPDPNTQAAFVAQRILELRGEVKTALRDLLGL